MIRIKTKIVLLIAVLAHAFIIFSQEKPKQIKFKIIQTTDVHGAIFPYDFINNKKTNYSLASVYTFVQQQREVPDQETILIDNGDILQGQPVVYYSNFEDTTTTHVCAAVMNYMGYEAAAIGNHDIETGHAVYDRLVRSFNFPWLAANAVSTKTNEPYFKPYQIIERKGVKIAVLGLITPAIPKWLPENIWSGMKFNDMIETAKKWVEIIRKKEEPDIIIGLFHAGVDYKYNNESGEEYLNENASELVAEKVPGFDVVFAGHDHKEYNLFVKNADSSEVLILDPGSHAREVACANISLTWNEIKHKYDKSTKGDIVEMSNYPPDSAFLSVFHPYFESAEKYVDRKIGHCNKTFDARMSVFGNSEFVDFIQQIQLDITGADISVTSPLSYNFEIAEGDVSVRDMFKLYRFENLLYTMKLTGKEIKNYLEYSANLWFNQMKSANDPMLKYTIGKDGRFIFTNPFYNYSSAAGIKYTVDLRKPYGEKIKILGLENGKKFNMDKTYTVAINSYRGNGGGGHLINGAGIKKEELKNRIISSTDKDLRYYIIKYIEKKREINPSKRNNWQIIPQDWWQTAKDREYNLLFHK